MDRIIDILDCSSTIVPYAINKSNRIQTRLCMQSLICLLYVTVSIKSSAFVIFIFLIFECSTQTHD